MEQWGTQRGLYGRREGQEEMEGTGKKWKARGEGSVRTGGEGKQTVNSPLQNHTYATVGELSSTRFFWCPPHYFAVFFDS